MFLFITLKFLHFSQNFKLIYYFKVQTHFKNEDRFIVLHFQYKLRTKILNLFIIRN
jgi:hypothetical protein